MKNFFTTIFLIVLLLAGPKAWSQLGQVVLPTNAPLNFNPAFAGSSDKRKLNNSENIVIGARRDVCAGYLSYDQLSHALRGAWGVELVYSTDSTYDDVKLSGVYSPKFSLGNNWTLAPAIKLSLHRNLYRGPLPFITSANEVVRIEKYRFSPSFGLLLNSSNFYAGVSWNQPIDYLLADRSDFNIQTGLVGNLNLQAGYVVRPGNGAPWSLSFGGLATIQNEANRYVFHSLYNRRWFLLGMAVNRVNTPSIAEGATSIVPSLGYRDDTGRITISLNQFVSPGLSNMPGLEMGLVWFFNRKQSGESSAGSAFVE